MSLLLLVLAFLGYAAAMQIDADGNSGTAHGCHLRRVRL